MNKNIKEAINRCKIITHICDSQDIRALRVPEDDNTRSVILTKDLSLSGVTAEKGINNNVFLLAESNRVSYSWFTPNIRLANTNYVVLDKGGALHHYNARFLQEQGYRVLRFDTEDVKKSACFDPFRQIRGDEDALRMARIMIGDAEAEQGTEAYRSYELCIQVLAVTILYLVRRDARQNATSDRNVTLTSLKYMINASTSDALDKMISYVRAMDMEAFSDIEPLSSATAADKEDAIKACHAEMERLAAPDALLLTEKNELQISDLLTDRTAIFLSADPNERSCDWLIALLLDQAYGMLEHSAVYGTQTRLIEGADGMCYKAFPAETQEEGACAETNAQTMLCGFEAATITYNEKTNLFEIRFADDSLFASFGTAAAAHRALNTLREGRCVRQEDKWLPFETSFMLTNFTDIGHIPFLKDHIGHCCWFGISYAIHASHLADVSDVYGEETGVIINSCDTRIFAGGAQIPSLKNRITNGLKNRLLGYRPWENSMEDADQILNKRVRGKKLYAHRKIRTVNGLGLKKTLTEKKLVRLPHGKCLVYAKASADILRDSMPGTFDDL